MFTKDPSNDLKKSGDKCQNGRSKISLITLATGGDYCLLLIGSVSALLHGAALPLLSIVIGKMTSIFLRVQQTFVYPQNTALSHGGALDEVEFGTSIATCCTYYIIIGFAAFVTSYLQVASLETFAERLTYKIRQRYVKAVLRQETAWFDCQQTGNIVGRLTDDLERVREGIGDKLSLLLQAVACCLTGFLIGSIYNWHMTVAILLFTPVIAAATAWIGRTASTQSSIEQEAYGVANSIAQQAFSSIKTILSLNGVTNEIKRYEDALEICRKTSRVKYFCMGLGYGLISFSTYASYAAAFWLAALLIADDPAMDRGTVFTVLFSVMSGASSLGGALSNFVSLASAFGSARKVLDVIEMVPQIDAYSDSGTLLSSVKGTISFHSVSFSYPSRRNIRVLKGLTFTVAAGKKVALVGASGSGKSTIASLIMRLYDPSSGMVAVDNYDLRYLNVRSLRDQIGFVAQEPVLFDGTIESNIKLGSVEITREQIISACRQANAWEFIEQMPDGLNTRVGEQGAQLSVGQKQRIAIARAVVRNPKILVFDEATSALDSECEILVQNALEKVRQGKTILIIAHRLSTVKNADEILVLDNGRITEHGKHEELLARKSTYYEMVTAQELTTDHENTAEINADTAETAIKRQHMSDWSKSKTSIRPSLTDILNINDESVQPATLKKIFMANRDSWLVFVFGLIGCCISGLIQPFFSMLYSQIFSVFSEQSDHLLVDAKFWSWMFVLCGATSFIGSFSGINLTGFCGESVTKKLRMDAFTNVMKQDLSFFDNSRYSSGNLCTRFATDAPNVRYVFTRLPVVAASGVTLIGAVVIGFCFGWQLALVLLPIIPLVIGSGYFDWKLQARKQLKGSELLESSGKVITEAVANIRTVQTLNRQSVFYEQYCHHLRGPYIHNLAHAHVYGGMFAFSQSLVFFMYATSFYLGSIFVRSYIMEPVNVYRVFFAIAFCGQSVGQISSFIPDVVKARLSASHVFHLSQHQTLVDPLSDEGCRTEIYGKVTLNNVNFSYPARPNSRILGDFSLSVEAGETVALVGSSGCGKSTVMMLLERFYEPQGGEILIDGRPIDEINLRWLRTNMCIVCQEPALFDASIEENITYGIERDVSHDEVVEASKLANIHDFIMTLPKGYETRVGEEGRQLSGGQKQRIAIARALVRKPTILLLDEATSALDTESEKAVQKAIDNARVGRTCIIIAHRLSTVQNSDSIAVLRDGQIVEKGTHDELLNRDNSIYKSLCSAQRLTVAASDRLNL